MKRDELGTWAVASLGAMSGGGAFVVGKLAVGSLPPATIAALRYALAVVIFAGLLAASRQPWPRPSRRDWIMIGGMGLTAVVGYNLLLFEALRHAPAAEGGLLVPGSAPIFIAILAAAVFREYPGGLGLLGVALATVGLLVLLAAGGAFASLGAGRVLGDALYVAGGLMWGLFFAFARGLGGRIPSLAANAYAATIGLILLAPLALLRDGTGPVSHLKSADLVEVAYLAAAATVLLLWSQVRAVERLGVVRSIPLAYIVPLTALLGAVVFLGERLRWLEVVGGLIALAGTYLAARGRATAGAH